MSRPVNFLLEGSPAPIYQRIVEALGSALEKSGHHIVWLRPGETKNIKELLEYISARQIDVCLITNNIAILSSYLKESGKFVFELVGRPVIFVHHDNLFSTYQSPDIIAEKIRAFMCLGNRGYHFCIEPYNCADLKSLGISNVYHFFHASEFSPDINFRGVFQYDVTFVGHVVPNTFDWEDSKQASRLIAADFWNRVEKLDSRIEPGCTIYADMNVHNRTNTVDWFSEKHYYVALIHEFSQLFRGEVFSRLGDFPTDIFGGDPGYMYGKTPDRLLQKKGLNYHPPVHDYSATEKIYQESKINLNVTSLQFDAAVINRVIDAGAAGGFILTDFKTELRSLTSVYKEISCHTVGEMNEKIEYYLGHETERMDIARQLNIDILERCTYKAAVESILSRVMPGLEQESGIANDTESRE